MFYFRVTDSLVKLEHVNFKIKKPVLDSTIDITILNEE